jgi:hypothetical protein
VGLLDSVNYEKKVMFFFNPSVNTGRKELGSPQYHPKKWSLQNRVNCIKAVPRMMPTGKSWQKKKASPRIAWIRIKKIILFKIK